MNRYRDKSDFEINKAVAVNKLSPELIVEKNNKIYISEGDSGVIVRFDPCKNPADAMPIVIENGISSLFNGDEWICSVPYTEFLSINESLYRAAMEVFLMMKEAENEK